MGMAWAVAARTRDFLSLGIDAEALMSPESAEAVRATAFTSSEQRGRHFGPATLTETLIFSAKESIFKCLNPLVGEFIDFMDFELASVNLEEGLLSFRCVRALTQWMAQGARLGVRFIEIDHMVLTAAAWPEPTAGVRRGLTEPDSV
jgi:enterobactin synthetase component D